MLSRGDIDAIPRVKLEAVYPAHKPVTVRANAGTATARLAEWHKALGLLELQKWTFKFNEIIFPAVRTPKMTVALFVRLWGTAGTVPPRTLPRSQ